MQKIPPFLWFDRQAEEAINFYVSVFNGSPHKTGKSGVLSIARYEKGMEVPGGDDMTGKVITAIFELNDSISFYVECEDQPEVDYFWKKLSAVPEMEQCGWLKAYDAARLSPSSPPTMGTRRSSS